jgi:hypothetical protein
MRDAGLEIARIDLKPGLEAEFAAQLINARNASASVREVW